MKNKMNSLTFFCIVRIFPFRDYEHRVSNCIMKDAILHVKQIFELIPVE